MLNDIRVIKEGPDYGGGESGATMAFGLLSVQGIMVVVSLHAGGTRGVAQQAHYYDQGMAHGGGSPGGGFAPGLAERCGRLP
jgi:hypothetical protein